MIAPSDDGIVVVVRVEDFDWDRFEAEGEAIARRMQDVSRTMAEQNAASRAERARYEMAAAGRTEPLARETPSGGVEARLDRLELRLDGVERTLTAMARDLSDIRERMATKVELEAMRESVQMIADGYAQTQHRLAETSGLLKRYVTTE